MKNIINYDVRGLLCGEEKVLARRMFAKGLDTPFRGHKIDEIKINATITTQKELADFMEFIYLVMPAMINSEKLKPKGNEKNRKENA